MSQKHGYLHWVDADFPNSLRIHGAIPVPNLTMVLQTSAPVDVPIRTEFPHRLRTRTSGMPICLDSFTWARDTPRARFQEKDRPGMPGVRRPVPRAWFRPLMRTLS